MSLNITQLVNILTNNRDLATLLLNSEVYGDCWLSFAINGVMNADRIVVEALLSLIPSKNECQYEVSESFRYPSIIYGEDDPLWDWVCLSKDEIIVIEADEPIKTVNENQARQLLLKLDEAYECELRTLCVDSITKDELRLKLKECYLQLIQLITVNMESEFIVEMACYCDDKYQNMSRIDVAVSMIEMTTTRYNHVMAKLEVALAQI